ncbi:DHS-like NAD/FAD-binding domain-containing protein [Paraphoma chrysanthemicola]|uniref:DHS-like NAD/FAD-binding domain-containing protein n=1 Tax=Paraphoma chrysanthemicola TaxID=798071 RepID=A0A8K0R8C6_9PLEO|nr:DHS-like NAD/FAD-binding domain-containing protein [Paraphoma chrysanthemicola]
MSKAAVALKSKQERRKFRGSSTPDPAIGIPLDDFTSFAQHLQSSKRIFALIGAGLSVSSGLSTFRGNDRRWRGAELQTLSDIDAFWDDPVLVWWFFTDRMKRAQEARPNRGHVALAKLAEAKEGFFAVNQNIDGLYQRAGSSDEQIAQVHGTLFKMKCARNVPDWAERCDYVTAATYSINEALEIPADTDISDPSIPLPKITREQLPQCPRCASIMRPAVVMFGEATPEEITKRIYDFTSAGRIDLMLVIGTSAVVLPAAMYIPRARNAGARVAYFNMEECEEKPGRVEDGDWMFKGDAAETVPECLKGVIGMTASQK